IAAGSVAAAIIACGGSSDGGTTGPTPVFTSVSVLPATPSVSVGSTTTLTATAKDQNGANFAGAPAATWTSSNTAAATVDASGVVTGVSNGNATITASITAGSVTHTGMQPVSVSTPSATGNVQATTTLAFDPSNLTVARSSGTASVTWHFQTVQHTVTWDATAGAEDDIPATASANIARNFTVAGTYHYHCAIHPSMTGVVTVQ
ncbi:MAG: Ig-like domain-containing protein, partial [Gemmatimonadota bacterium]